MFKNFAQCGPKPIWSNWFQPGKGEGRCLFVVALILGSSSLRQKESILNDSSDLKWTF